MERSVMDKMQKRKYYLGLDIGTDSVGFAVTDEKYNILKFNGKAIWGSRLFDEAQTAAGRRLWRATRRRGDRRKWRIGLLQEIFANAICQIDVGFYQRMKDSALFPEDKTEAQSYALFAGNEFNDHDFYKKYPTIYHLRKELILSDEKIDIRLIYLAIHHIVKHRGHFLFEGDLKQVTEFSFAYERMQQRLCDELNIDFICYSKEKLSSLLKEKNMTKTDKVKRILDLFPPLIEADAKKQMKAIVGLFCGSKVKLADVFLDDSLKDIEKPSFSFADGAYEDLHSELEDVLEERCNVVDDIKGLYDWAVLADIMAGGQCGNQSFLSVAKVNSYEKHKRDLVELKDIVKKYCPQEYKTFFQRSGVANYCAYVGSVKIAGKSISVKKCSVDDFLKNVRKLVGKAVENGFSEALAQKIQTELDAQTFLPLQVSKDNSVIPHQVHGMELKKILQNASRHYPFLSEKDNLGLSPAEKVQRLFEFRIPYYVGPLNTSVGENSWMVRRAEGRIYPWDFEEKVNLEDSAEKFRRRMTNKCSYLMREDVLPKNSLRYSEFMVWNELNNIKVGAEKLSVELKEDIFENLFRCKKRVTVKMLCEALKANGLKISQADISGIDKDFKSSLAAYIDLKHIFGERINCQSLRNMCEDLILWIVLYHDDVKMLRRVIRKHYTKEQITDDQMKKICRLSYQGWGRLSKRFLGELEGTDIETGETFTVLEGLQKTNDNLMQLLSQKYTFSETVEKENSSDLCNVCSFTYESLVKEIPVSPSVKRAIWQVLSIVTEIKKVMHGEPERIFLEMARGAQEKKRTVSRKDRLLALYKNIKEEERDWKTELEQKPESDFRSIKLYLYYTQMGKCMYSEEPIELSNLADTNIYDRDHIYPQSKTKDDSLDNLVLVKKSINSEKDNRILSPKIQARMWGFWKKLKEKGLISDIKYSRLMRTTPLTDEELAGFINRQLVEVRQSSKIVAELFKQIYPNSAVVYVKAGTVADFRQEKLKIVKVRMLNDFHHAKDAYLNIVVGNVYYEKFTSNPLQWLRKHKGETYSLNHMFDFSIIRKDKNGEHIVWKPGEKGTLDVVRKAMHRNDILYTRQAITNKGELFNQQIVSSTEKPSIPIKKGLDVKKYGGYKSVNPACFSLVESVNKKGEKQRTIEPVPLYLKENINQNADVYICYCKEKLGLLQPRIILSKIKKNALLKIDGFLVHLRGVNEKQLTLQCAVQLSVNEKYELYMKKIEKYIRRNLERKDKKKLLTITEMEEITTTENLALYDEFCNKQKNTIYKYRPANQYKTLLDGREKFIKLTIEEQCTVLEEILHLMQCKPILADLHLIGGSKDSGKTQFNKIISKSQQAWLINQSITGLFEQKVDLLTIDVKSEDL